MATLRNSLPKLSYQNIKLKRQILLSNGRPDRPLYRLVDHLVSSQSVEKLMPSVVKIAATLVAPILIEYQGRRRLLLVGGCVMSLALFAAGGMLRAPALTTSPGFAAALISVM
jgi:hypothetical protein